MHIVLKKIVKKYLLCQCNKDKQKCMKKKKSAIDLLSAACNKLNTKLMRKSQEKSTIKGLKRKFKERNKTTVEKYSNHTSNYTNI